MIHHKYLVRLIESISEKQIFFILWFLVVGGFIWLILSYQRKSMQRNFRAGAYESQKKDEIVVADRGRAPQKGFQSKD